MVSMKTLTDTAYKNNIWRICDLMQIIELLPYFKAHIFQETEI